MENKVKATPAARRIASERRIRLSELSFSRERGYVCADDVLRFKGASHTPLALAVAKYHGVDINKIAKDGLIRKDDVLRFVEVSASAGAVPVAGMRKVIATRMAQSMASAPQYSMFMDYDMDTILRLFRDHKQKCVEKGLPKPTLSDVFIKLFALALKEKPIVNSTFTEQEIILHKDINIGLAVALDDGLVVPNIKNADALSLEEITEERTRLVNRAREGRLLPDEYEGGTFTISNLGGYSVEYATPIINQPESAIVVVGATVDKVVPVDRGVGIRPVMGMSFTFDHRHLDGAVGGEFMKTVRQIFDGAEKVF